MANAEVFERTRQPLDLHEPTDEALGIAEALPGVGKTLTFQVQQQSQTLWCWIAVAVSVNHFYNAGSSISQCALANTLLNTNICCSNGFACNQMGRLDFALARIQNLLPPIRPLPLSFVELRNFINNNRLLGCGIRWSTGLAHFVAIYGFSTDFNGVNWVAVADPMYGATDLPYETFVQQYRGSGRWVFSYLTTP
jgi:Papain-like cysteine protease AvrRpt2